MFLFARWKDTATERERSVKISPGVKLYTDKYQRTIWRKTESIIFKSKNVEY